MLEEIAGINKSQDEELARQADLAAKRYPQMLQELQSRGQAQDAQISELTATKIKQAEEIKAIQEVNEMQSREIADLKEKYLSLQAQLQSNCTSLQTQQTENNSSLQAIMATKASKTIGMVSTILGASGLVLAIMHFSLSYWTEIYK